MLTINHLCDNFYFLKSQVKDRVVKDTGISRLEWHALNLHVLGLVLEDLKALLYVALHEECRHGWVGEIAVFYG